MAASESGPPYVTRKFFTMLDCPAAYHTSPNTTSFSAAVALPAQPAAHVAVMVKVVAPCESGVGCRKAFQRPSAVALACTE